MPSSGSTDDQPRGTDRVPRRGARTLKERHVRIEADRRTEIDLHYLGHALLRLAQQQYDAERSAHDGAESGASRTAERPAPGPPTALTPPNAASMRERRRRPHSGPPTRPESPTG